MVKHEEVSNTMKFNKLLWDVGWTMKRFARQIGFSHGAIRDWHSGKTTVPSDVIDYLIRLNDAILNVGDARIVKRKGGRHVRS